MQTVRFHHVADIQEAAHGHVLAATSVADDGTGLFLFVGGDGASEVFAKSGERAQFPATNMSRAHPAQLVETDGISEQRTDLVGMDVAFPLVQRLPNGEILIVGMRCYLYPDGSHDLNGLVFGPDGRLDRRMLLGDGIEHLCCDSNGRIWVSYTDEGIYGNYGWGQLGGRKPVGKAGLVCFDTNGDEL